MRSTSPLPVVLEPCAQEQAPTLRNLFELYAYDFSEVVPLELNSDGRFDVGVGEHWWSSGDHFPFLIRHDHKLCGFALVRKGSRLTGASDVMDVAEFFVVRGARRKGIGTSAAHALFDSFLGPWEIRVRQSNPGALRFWSRAVEGRLGRSIPSRPFSSEGVDWQVLCVEFS